MKSNPIPQQIYRHFKGKLYQIISLAEHSETGEMLVVYQALYGEFKIYARPLSLFLDKVDKEKYPNAIQEYRFELQTGSAAAEAAARTDGAEAEAQAQTDSTAEAAADGAAAETEARTGSTAEAQAQTDSTAEAAVDGAAAETAAQTGSTAEAVLTPPARTAQAMEESSEAETEFVLDPLVLEFLDADSYEERLNVLTALHYRISDDMINTMAMAIDVEIEENDDIEQRYEELRSCLLLYDKFECNRLR